MRPCWTYSLSVLAIVGSVLNVRGDGRCFALWAAANVGWLVWSVRRRIWPQSLIWSCFLATSLWGMISEPLSAPGYGPGPAESGRPNGVEASRAGSPATPAAPAALTRDCPAKERPLPQQGVERLLAAMRRVESGGIDSAVGDGGRSLGLWQIGYLYYMDAAEQIVREGSHDEVAGSGRPARSRQAWRAGALGATSARLLVLAYWRRYCPEALAGGGLETLARVHNGGPDGARERQTLAYWQRVRAVMEGGR